LVFNPKHGIKGNATIAGAEGEMVGWQGWFVVFAFGFEVEDGEVLDLDDRDISIASLGWNWS
jgi:hypothetical protein